MASRRLSIYLNDHFAGSIAGGELARRSAGANRGTPLGAELERLVREIEEDRNFLERIMRQLGVGIDRKKVAAAWLAEKVGRLKLNGSLISYSSLSRLVELEALTVAVEGKRLLWEALARDPEVPGDKDDLDRLIDRARSQRRRLDRHRRRAIEDAL